MYPSIVQVVPHDDHTLSIVFEDGRNGVLDIKPLLEFGVFKRISPLEEFNQVRIAFDSIEWDCGVDLDPEYVYVACSEQSTA